MTYVRQITMGERNYFKAPAPVGVAQIYRRECRLTVDELYKQRGQPNRRTPETASWNRWCSIARSQTTRPMEQFPHAILLRERNAST